MKSVLVFFFFWREGIFKMSVYQKTNEIFKKRVVNSLGLYEGKKQINDILLFMNVLKC